MRKLFAIALLFLSLTISSKAATILVDMLTSPNLFAPANIVIDVGDTVVWTNRTFTFHDTVSSTGLWASSLFGRGGSFRFTFNVAPGVYNYYCSPHRPGMVGTVTVRGVNNPPTATITAPADNSTFRPTDTITVAVSAADDGSVAKVELLVDGNITQTDTSLPYQFNLSLSTGQHTLAARATDDKNSATTSTPITVNISAANQPPTVAITTPANDSSFIEPADITIQAQADDDDAVDHVEFLINGVSAVIDSTAPYSLTQTYTNGMYMVLARAFDGEGLQTTSAEIMFTVTEPIPDIPQVSIVKPIEFDFFEFPFGSTNVQVPLIARAIDLNGSIAQVEFFSYSASLGTAAFTGVSNQFQLNLVFPEGVHVITARATDNGGLISTSQPVAFTVLMSITNTYSANLQNGFMRLGYFGSSGLEYFFESSADLVTFTPYMTNVLRRRIRFFDVPIDEHHRNFIAHAPAPGTPTDTALQMLQNGPFQFFTNNPPLMPTNLTSFSPLDPLGGHSKIKSLKPAP